MHRPQDHLHPVPARELQRRRPRRAEELGPGPRAGRLLPLRHQSRTGPAEHHLGLDAVFTNYLLPQQKLVSKVRTGAKVSKKYDAATTPHRRAERHAAVSDEDKAILAATYTGLNPAAVQRQIQALTAELLTITTSKAGPTKKAPATRAPSDEATNQTSRAS